MGYATGTASDSDDNDIDDFGTKGVTVNLGGLSTYKRALRAASYMLRKSLSNPDVFSLKTGPKKSTIKPGDVWTLTDSPAEVFAVPARILSISEGKDYTIDVSAEEEIPAVYTPLALTGDAPTTPARSTDFGGYPWSDPVRPVAIEIPPHFTTTPQVAMTWSRPNNAAFSGVSVYRGYDTAGPFTRLQTVHKSGSTGLVIAVDRLAGHFDVQFDADIILAPATSLEALLTSPGQNMLAVITAAKSAALFLRFEDAELIATNTYRLSNVVFDLAGTPRLNQYDLVGVGDTVCDAANIPVRYDLPLTDEGRTIWTKLAAVNRAGLEKTLANVSPMSITTDYLVHRPLPVFGVTVNGLPVEIKEDY